MDQQLESVKTYLIIAFVFAILALIPWALGLVFMSLLVLVGAIVASVSSNPLTAGIATMYAGSAIAYAVFWLIFWGGWLALGIICLLRIKKMRAAADCAKINDLKALNSVGWAVAAIFFSGIIPGIMLLIASGPIRGLRVAGAGVLSVDDMTTLAKLKGLVDKGVISQAEFDTQKERLLGGVPVPAQDGNELQQLKALKDAGALSEEEYEAQKQKFLAGL